MMLPKQGDRYRDDKGNIHTIECVQLMFARWCIFYSVLGEDNHYIVVDCLHLHSSGDFWFKEPLTDNL